MANTNILTLRLDAKLKKKLDRLAKATERSRSFLIAEAVRDYVALNEWQIEEIKKALRETDASNFVSEEEMQQTISKWVRRAG